MNELSGATAKAGTLLLVSEGAYSSYEANGFFVVLTDFKPKALLEEFSPEATLPKKRFEPTEFLAFLLKKGLLLEVNYSELWCGSYGEARGGGGVHFWPIGHSRFT